MDVAASVVAAAAFVGDFGVDMELKDQEIHLGFLIFRISSGFRWQTTLISRTC